MKKFFITLLVLSFTVLSSVNTAHAQKVKDDWNISCATAICAAYSTEGLWTLGSILKNLGVGADPSSPEAGTNQGYITMWGGLIYMFAFLGALIMMALGQPPKMYGWFALGPAVFYFLLMSQEQFNGVSWQLGHKGQEQTTVWRLLEPGMNNSAIIQSAGTATVDPLDGVSGTIGVPQVVIALDSIVSETVQNLISLFGLYEETGKTANSNLPKDRDKDADNWHLLSNLKWQILEDVTSNRLSNNDLRDLFVVFMASECGDTIGEFIDNKSIMIADSTSDGRPLKDKFALKGHEANTNSDPLQQDLESTIIPMPYSLSQLLKQTAKGNPGFVDVETFGFFAFSQGTEEEYNDMSNQPAISCMELLRVIMAGFHWESRIHYWNLPAANETDGEVTNELLDYTFLYGWTFDKHDGSGKSVLNATERPMFMKDMIMAYMFRNEITLAPTEIEQRMLPSEKAMEFAEKYQASVGAKSKFGEFYIWSTLMPYMQGLLLYILSVGYPLACVMVLIPGQWKWMFTWATFYIWAKSWDVGFAIVMGLERSIWASIGNTLGTSGLNGRLYDIQGISQTEDACADRVVSTIDNTFVACNDVSIIPAVESGYEMTYAAAINLFDKLLLLSRSLNHDLANSYYIYLMSALYFAVPAVTGQIILGAKAGASQFVSNAVQGVSSDGGGATKAGTVGNLTTAGKMSMQSMQQTAIAKAARQEGFALQAIQAKNDTSRMDLFAGQHNARARQKGIVAEAMGDRASQLQQLQNVQDQEFAHGGAIASAMPGKIGEFARRSVGSSDVNEGMYNTLKSIDSKIGGGQQPGSSAPGSGASNKGSGALPGGVAQGNAGAPAQGQGGGASGSSAKATGRGKWYKKLGRGALGAPGYILDKQGSLDGVWYRAEEARTNYEAQVAKIKASQADREERSAAEIASFASQSYGRGLGEASGRYDQRANYNAQMAARRQQMKYAYKMNDLTAMGVFAGTFDPSIPTDLQSLGAGQQLDKHTAANTVATGPTGFRSSRKGDNNKFSNAFEYFNRGGEYQGQVTRRVMSLGANYGSNASNPIVRAVDGANFAMKMQNIDHSLKTNAQYTGGGEMKRNYNVNANKGAPNSVEQQSHFANKDKAKVFIQASKDFDGVQQSADNFTGRVASYATEPLGHLTKKMGEGLEKMSEKIPEVNFDDDKPWWNEDKNTP